MGVVGGGRGTTRRRRDRTWDEPPPPVVPAPLPPFPVSHEQATGGTGADDTEGPADRTATKCGSGRSRGGRTAGVGPAGPPILHPPPRSRRGSVERENSGLPYSRLKDFGLGPAGGREGGEWTWPRGPLSSSPRPRVEPPAPVQEKGEWGGRRITSPFPRPTRR